MFPPFLYHHPTPTPLQTHPTATHVTGNCITGGGGVCLNQGYSHITDCNLDSVVYAGICVVI